MLIISQYITEEKKQTPIYKWDYKTGEMKKLDPGSPEWQETEDFFQKIKREKKKEQEFLSTPPPKSVSPEAWDKAHGGGGNK